MEFNNVREVLSFIQRTISVPKNRKNTFGNYNYRSAEDIVDAVKTYLPDGAVLQLSDEVVEIGGRIYVRAKAILEYTDGAASSYGYARESETKKGMDESQITGAASSYARKYALCGLFAIDDGIDADSQNKHDDAPKAYKAPKVAEISLEQKSRNWFIAKIATIKTWDAFDEFLKGQKNKDARDSLFAANQELSKEVEDAITAKKVKLSKEQTL